MPASNPFQLGDRVVAYLRHSPGDLQTIASQEAFVRQWCADNGLVLARVYCDEAKSGTTVAGRDRFLAMNDDLQGGDDIRGVVLWSFSRFAREVNAAEYYKSQLRLRGYIVHSLSDDIPPGDFAPVVEAFIHWKDGQLSKEISRQAKRGLHWLAQQGYSVGGFPPRGYIKSEPVEVGVRKNGTKRLAHKWVVDPEWAERVRIAWRMRLAGQTLFEIHRTTRLFRSINCYTSFFRNQTYCGVRKCGELRVEAAHEAYITREDFERVQRLVEGRNRSGNPLSPARRRADNPFLLSGLLLCGYCNSTLVGGNNGRYQFYRCDGRTRRSLDCAQRYMVAHRLHEALSGWVMDHVLVPDLMRAHRDQLANTQAISREIIEQRLRLAEQQRKILQESIERLLDAIEAGAREAVERLSARRLELLRVEQEESDLRATLALEKLTIEDQAIERLCDYMREKLVSGKPEQARKVLRDCISDARLFNDRVELTYLPLPLGVFHPMPPRGYQSKPCKWRHPTKLCSY